MSAKFLLPCVIVAAAIIAPPTIVGASQVWLQPWPPCDWCGWAGESDTDQLFDSDDKWRTSASGVNVLVLTAFLLYRLDDTKLRLIASWLNAHHIDADLDIAAMPANAHCGSKIEGYGDPAVAERTAHRLKVAGIIPRYITMDEPLWGGHYLNISSACRLPIHELTTGIASMINIYAKYFPDVEVEDTEPYAATMTQSSWKEDLRQFVTELRGIHGVELTAIWIDSGWGASWRSKIPEFVNEVHSLHLKAGLIYDAKATDDTDEAAVDSTRREFIELEDELGVSLDLVSFGGWYTHPTHLLPESDPGAQTRALADYMGKRGIISVSISGHETSGKLRQTDGSPISGASIQLQMLVGNVTGPLIEAQMSGNVPFWASQAKVGFRVNTEGNPEEYSSLRLAVQGWSYTETAEGRVSQVGTFGRPSVESASTKPVAADAQAFGVTPGAAFRVSIAEGVDRPAYGASHGVLTFLSRDGSKSERRSFSFPQLWRRLLETKTNLHGRFTFSCKRIPQEAELRILALVPNSVHETVMRLPASLCLIGPSKTKAH